MSPFDFRFQDYDPETTRPYQAPVRPARVLLAWLDEGVDLGWLRALLRAFAQSFGPDADIALCLYAPATLSLAPLLASLGEAGHPGVRVVQDAEWPQVLAFGDCVINLSRSEAEPRAIQALLLEKEFVSDRATPIGPFGPRILHYADFDDAAAWGPLLQALAQGQVRVSVRRLALEWLAGRIGKLHQDAIDLAMQQGQPELAAQMCSLFFRQNRALPLPLLDKFMQIAYLADDDRDMEAYLREARQRMRELDFRLQRLWDPTRSLLGSLTILDREPDPDEQRVEAARATYREAFDRCLAYLVYNRIHGEVLEFGTYGGFTARILAELMMSYGFAGGLHLYDSFQGLPESRSPEDRYSYHVLERSWGKGSMNQQAHIEKRVQRAIGRILPPERVFVTKGFYSETLPQALPTRPAALVHIDCDLYESALCVLNHLLERKLLQDGCVLLFDDYNCNRAQPKMGERKALQDAFARQRHYSTSRFFSYSWGGEACFVHAAIG